MTQIRFTKKEAKVLDLLERNAGRIVTRKVLLESVWVIGKGQRPARWMCTSAGFGPSWRETRMYEYTPSLAWVTYWRAVAGRPKAKSSRRYRSSSDKPRQLRIRSRLTREHLLAGQPE